MPGARNRWSIEQDILEQALGARSELRRLERDPRAALEQELGERLPPDVTVRLAFDTRRKHHQVIPFEGHAVLGSIDPPTGDDAIDGLRGISVEAAYRVVRDPAFRARLLADATGFAREGLHNPPFPRDLEIVLLHEDARTIWLTVPMIGRKHIRQGRPGRPDRPDRPDRPGRPNRPDRPGRPQ